ncbi:MAG TPA: hypothetical protein VEK57_07960 [Thermoanaerobaculia bacterium]|nr:hypothetical protein [Thermoanaerobaculia bacterium]
MNRLLRLSAFTLAMAAVAAAPLLAEPARRPSLNEFASDFQTVPVMGNTPGLQGARFQTYVAILNPTDASYPVDVTLYLPSGATQMKTIALGPGELKTYPNFLDDIFDYTGGGAVTFRSPNSANRFIIDAEVWTTGDQRYGTDIPSLEFAGSASPSFAPGVANNATTRTNVGCFNQSGVANVIGVRVRDHAGTTVSTTALSLPAHGWGQVGITGVVTDGYVELEPEEAAVCYAVVVDNETNDGRFISATEYQP